MENRTLHKKHETENVFSKIDKTVTNSLWWDFQTGSTRKIFSFWGYVR